MIEVVAALIWDQGRFMICQRPAHKARGLLWEFVGGKVEVGESGEEALVRECREELGIDVSVGNVFMQVTHAYPDITVHLTLYNATIRAGTPVFSEHIDMRWITPAEIPAYAFCPADEVILAKLSGQPYIHIASGSDMEAVFAIRYEVFVEEQRVPLELERDEEDAHALHIVAEEDGVAVGCARVLLHGDEAHIGRLAVKKVNRGKGIGAAICRSAIAQCREKGCVRLRLHAQLHAVAFYEKLGFRPCGEIFWEAGIQHREMVMDV